MRNLEVILGEDALVAQGHVPDADASSRVTSKEAACITELETIWMNLVENCTFRSGELLLVRTRVLHFALRSHDQSESFIVKLISLINARLCGHSLQGFLHDRQLM